MASKKQTTVLTSLALVLGLGLAGCSGDSPAPKNDEKSQSQEQEQTTAASEQLTAENFAERMNAAQLEAGSAHMTLDASMGDATTAAEADMLLGAGLDDTAMHMTMEGAGMTMEMIMVGGEVYMNMGELTQGKFAKFPTEQIEQLGVEEIQEQSNPAAQAELYQKALTDFVAEEGEEIDGVQTTKYTVTLDTRALLEESGGEVNEEVLAQMGETMTYVMFVGDDDLPRRMVTNMETGTTTIEFSKWGEPVDITAPSEDELTELPF